MNLKTQKEIATKLEYDFELPYKFIHKGCKAQAYPVWIIDEFIIWECLEHGFIAPRAVDWK